MKTILLTLTLISLVAIKSMACDGDPSCPMNSEKMNPEKRAEMATVHSKMAECLKSDKSMEECHKLMAGHMGGKMGDHKSCSKHGKMEKSEDAKEVTAEPKK